MSLVDDDAMLVRVANLYYKQNLTQQAVAQRLSISRSLVSKLLTSARDRGIVEITVHDRGVGSFFRLEEQMREVFGLREVLCVDAGVAPADDPSGKASGRVAEGGPAMTIVAKRSLGTAAAHLLPRYIPNGARVLVSSGETLHAAAKAFSVASSLPDTTFIPASGGLDDVRSNLQSSHICHILANGTGAKARQLHAPIVVSSPEVRDLLMEEPFVKDVLAEARNSDVALIGVGACDTLLEGSPGIPYGATLSDEVVALSAAGRIKGDISFNYFDASGKTVDCAFSRRSISLTLDEICAVPTVVCVAGGSEKLVPLSIVLERRMVDVLITDNVTAEALLAKKKEGR